MTAGKIYLVPTPIGNLKDITLRALDILFMVKLILAEDTRVTAKLLNHYGISKPLKSLHAHNEHQMVYEILQTIHSGFEVAYCTDAGTPGISDPGHLLVREAIKLNIEIESLPGATAFVPALVNSGLPCDRFVFEGFLPPKKGRKNKIQEIAEEEKTTIIYESPHKILKTLDEISQYVEPQRRICVAKELSKVHETYYRGNINEVKNQLKASNVKGEFIIVLQAKSTK